MFCEKLDLIDGPHQITVNVTSVTGQVFWFDDIQYVPSANVTEPFAYVRVENSDPAISYSSGWSGIGNIANMTTSPGAQMHFNFVGASLF